MCLIFLFWFRESLFGLVKFYLQKEVNAKEVAALTNFCFAMHRQPLVLGELLSMLTLHLDSKQGRHQFTPPAPSPGGAAQHAHPSSGLQAR